MTSPNTIIVQTQKQGHRTPVMSIQAATQTPNYQRIFRNERAIIGAVIKACAEGNQGVYHQVARILTARDFTNTMASYLWHAIDISVKAGEAIDEMLLADKIVALLDTYTNDDVDRVQFEILDYTALAPQDSTVLDQYIKLVADNAIRARLHDRACKIQALALDDTVTLDELTEFAHAGVIEVTSKRNRNPTDIASLAESYEQRAIDMVDGKQEMTISSGFGTMDDVSMLYKQAVTVIVGMGGMGKTTWLLSSAMQQAHRIMREKLNAVVVIVSIEMTYEELMSKLIQQLTGLDKELIVNPKDMNPKEISAFYGAIQTIKSLPIEIIDSKTGITKPIQIRSELHRIAATKDIYSLMIDGLWLMSPDNAGDVRADALMSVNNVSQNLTMKVKAIAVDFCIPVVALHQYNQDAVQRSDKRPRLTDMKWGQPVQQDLNDIWGMYRPIGADIEADTTPVTSFYGLKGRSNNKINGAHFQLLYDTQRDLYRDILSTDMHIVPLSSLE